MIYGQGMHEEPHKRPNCHPVQGSRSLATSWTWLKWLSSYKSSLLAPYISSHWLITNVIAKEINKKISTSTEIDITEYWPREEKYWWKKNQGLPLPWRGVINPPVCWMPCSVYFASTCAFKNQRCRIPVNTIRIWNQCDRREWVPVGIE